MMDCSAYPDSNEDTCEKLTRQSKPTQQSVYYQWFLSHYFYKFILGFNVHIQSKLL